MTVAQIHIKTEKINTSLWIDHQVPAYPVEESTDMVFRLADRFLASLSVISLWRIWKKNILTSLSTETWRKYGKISLHLYTHSLTPALDQLRIVAIHTGQSLQIQWHWPKSHDLQGSTGRHFQTVARRVPVSILTDRCNISEAGVFTCRQKYDQILTITSCCHSITYYTDDFLREVHVSDARLLSIVIKCHIISSISFVIKIWQWLMY